MMRLARRALLSSRQHAPITDPSSASGRLVYGEAPETVHGVSCTRAQQAFQMRARFPAL